MCHRALIGACLVLASLVSPSGGVGAESTVRSAVEPTAERLPTFRPFAPGVSTTREIEFDKVITAETGPSGSGCHGSTWVVVPDLPKAASYLLTWRNTTLPGRVYTMEFNRHERGAIGGGWVPEDLTVGDDEIAARVVVNTTSGTCDSIELQHQQRYVFDKVVVTEFTANVPSGDQPGYTAILEPRTPASDGPDGKDSCTLHNFISVPVVPGAASYTVKLTQRIYGSGQLTDTRIVTHTLKPSDFDPTTPDAPGVGDYSVRGRLGHYLGAFKFGGARGCTYAAQQMLASPRVFSYTKATMSVTYEKCFGARPTIVATSRVTKGTDGHDVILGRHGVDEIDGRGGDDLICGRGGDDELRGGSGQDRIDGGRGTDRCIGDAGPRRLVDCERSRSRS